MTFNAPWRILLASTNRTAKAWLGQWWKLLHLAAVLLLLALSPSNYKSADRLALGRHLYDNTAPIMLGLGYGHSSQARPPPTRSASTS